MYASHLGALYSAVAEFQGSVGAMEREIERRGPGDEHRERLGGAIQGLMDVADQTESSLAGAEPLLAGTKQTFRTLTSDFFCRSAAIARALHKPRGYAGDHALLDMYYQGLKAHQGIDRILDDVLHGTPAVQAVLNRKTFVADWLAPRIAAHPGCRVVDLASGPCRVERDLIDSGRAGSARFVAIDQDPEALVYALEVLGPHSQQVELVQENAVRIARARQVHPALLGASYVVSLGLFDYLPRVLAAHLIRALRRAVAPGGELLIGNFATGNPTRTFMEWTADWVLIYRSEAEFLQLFLDAGFTPDDLTVERECSDGLVWMVTARVTGPAERPAGEVR